MAQYIDKDALVAEIERRMEDILELVHPNNYDKAALKLYKGLLSFINTLEVKEVDLQSEIDRVWDNTSDNFLVEGWKDFEDIAKHFFELGLQVSNKAQKREK